VEESQAILSIRMSNVVSELSKLIVLRADVRVIGGSGRVGLSIEPETVIV